MQLNLKSFSHRQVDMDAFCSLSSFLGALVWEILGLKEGKEKTSISSLQENEKWWCRQAEWLQDPDKEDIEDKDGNFFSVAVVSGKFWFLVAVLYWHQ